MMIEGFRERHAELRRKVLFAPRGPRKREALNQLRELMRQELVAEQRARKVAAPVPTSIAEPPPDLFHRHEDAPPAPLDPYGGREPYWVDN